MSRVLVFVSILLVCVGTALAQEEVAVPGITTSGTAVVMVPSDSVRLVFQLAVEAAMHDQAKEKLVEADRSLGQALHGLGIEGLQLESGPFEVGAHTRYARSGWGVGGGLGGPIGGRGAGGNPQAGKDQPEVHWASRKVIASVGGVGEANLLADHADRIQQSLPQDELSRLEEVRFFASPEVQAEAEREALRSATKNAIANAQAIAAAAGVTIVEYASISGAPVSYYTDGAMPAGATSGGRAQAAQEQFRGTLVVRCTVSVTAIL